MSKTKGKASPDKTGEVTQLTPEQIEILQSDLNLAKVTIQEKEELLSKANELLEAANATIQEKEELLAAANATIQEQQDLLLKENKTSSVPKEVKASKKSDTATLLFTYNGKRYTFSRKAPQKINVDGKVYEQQELIKDKELMVSLIVGNSPFIKNV